MSGQLLPNRGGSPRVRLDCADSRRWWTGRGAEQVCEDKAPTWHRRGVGAVGSDFQDTRLGQKTTPGALRGQSHFPEIQSLDARNSVMLGETTIQKGEVRINKLPHSQITPNHLEEKASSLLQHGLPQHIIILGIEFLIWSRGIDVL